MKNIAVIATCALAICLGAGCAHTPVPPRDTRVTLSPNLDDSVYVTDVRVARNKTGYLNFQANVVNTLSSQNIVEYKVTWLEDTGIEIDSVLSTWQGTALQPYEVKGLQATAPSPDAVDMRLYVRAR